MSIRKPSHNAKTYDQDRSHSPSIPRSLRPLYPVRSYQTAGVAIGITRTVKFILVEVLYSLCSSCCMKGKEGREKKERKRRGEIGRRAMSNFAHCMVEAQAAILTRKLLPLNTPSSNNVPEGDHAQQSFR